MDLSLKTKKIDISRGKKRIVLLHRETAKKYNIQCGSRIKIKKGRLELSCIAEFSDDFIKKDYIGLFAKVYADLKIKRGEKVSIDFAEKPKSLEVIKNKMRREQLSEEEYSLLINDIIEGNLSDTELAFFVGAVEMNDLTDSEVNYLTNAILKKSSLLKFREKIVMDKHSIGGVPGNRVSMLVVPIITAAGFKMPKTTSRAISSASGTADTFEVLCNVNHDAKNLKAIADKVGGFIADGSEIDLASADDALIDVRYALQLDPPGLLLASIMAKKIAAGSNTLVIDLPFGEGSKCKKKSDAKKLASRFKKLASSFNINLKFYFSDGTQPVGNGVGPVLEVADVMKVLRNNDDAPKDLREKALQIAGMLIDMSGRFWWKKGYNVAKKILDSGKAYEQMQKIISAQGARKKSLQPGKYTYDFSLGIAGKIKEFDTKKIIELARILGSPTDTAAGIYFYKKKSDKIQKKDLLFTIYASDKDRLNEGKIYLKLNQIIAVQ